MHGSWKLQEEPADDLKATQYSFTYLLMFCCVRGASQGLIHARQVVPAELHPSPPLGLIGIVLPYANQNINSLGQLDIVLIFSQLDTFQSHLKKGNLN